jgi:hypothetical protein
MPRTFFIIIAHPKCNINQIKKSGRAAFLFGCFRKDLIDKQSGKDDNTDQNHGDVLPLKCKQIFIQNVHHFFSLFLIMDIKKDFYRRNTPQ